MRSKTNYSHSKQRRAVELLTSWFIFKLWKLVKVAFLPDHFILKYQILLIKYFLIINWKIVLGRVLKLSTVVCWLSVSCNRGSFFELYYLLKSNLQISTTYNQLKNKAPNLSLSNLNFNKCFKNVTNIF